MTTANLLRKVEEAIKGELHVSVLYMWQHIILLGIKGELVKNNLKKIAIDEMRHAEKIAERLYYISDGKSFPPTILPEFKLTTDFAENLELNAELEKNTIALYKDIIDIAKKERDYTTATLFKHILSEEEKHHDYFTNVLVGKNQWFFEIPEA